MQAEESPDTAKSWQIGKRHLHYSGHRRGFGKGQQRADIPPELAGANRENIYSTRVSNTSLLVLSLNKLMLQRDVGV